MNAAVISLISLWVLRVQAECPVTCNCTTTSISCVNQDLEFVPKLYYLESSPVILDLSGNKLFFINEDDFNFPRSDEVKEIYLNSSSIADIGQGTFNNVENLQELYLGQNLLTNHSVPANLIEELDNMVLLDMSNNYFNGNMPIIRSESLEVLALVNSKISAIPENALEYLPHLKLLLLQQNNIQSLSFEPFRNYAPNMLFVRLSFNSWTCSCDNLRTFYLLGGNKFLDTSEPYQCISDENNVMNIFNTNGAVELIAQNCDEDIDNELQTTFVGHQEVRDMIDEDRKNDKYLKPRNKSASVDFPDESYEHIDDDDDDYKELDIKEMNDDDLEVALPGSCWEMLTQTYSNNRILTVALIITLISFFIGFISGAIFCKLVYTLRYKKLEQSSDSQVQLLKA